MHRGFSQSLSVYPLLRVDAIKGHCSHGRVSSYILLQARLIQPLRFSFKTFLSPCQAVNMVNPQIPRNHLQLISLPANPVNPIPWCTINWSYLDWTTSRARPIDWTDFGMPEIYYVLNCAAPKTNEKQLSSAITFFRAIRGMASINSPSNLISMSQDHDF